MAVLFALRQPASPPAVVRARVGPKGAPLQARPRFQSMFISGSSDNLSMGFSLGFKYAIE